MTQETPRANRTSQLSPGRLLKSLKDMAVASTALATLGLLLSNSGVSQAGVLLCFVVVSFVVSAVQIALEKTADGLTDASVEPYRIERLFGLIELLLPKRLANEELGDALEAIHELVAMGCPAWQIYTRAASAMFWVTVHASREGCIALLGLGKVHASHTAGPSSRQSRG